MFRRKNRSPIEITKLSSLVADNMAVTGDVRFSGGLRIDGRVEGNVLGEEGANGLLVLSGQGSIRGRVKTYDAVINGTIQGDLEVEHFLELQPGARVSGNITYRQLKLDCGATVDGQLVCAGEAPGAETAGGSPQAARPRGESTGGRPPATATPTPEKSYA